MNIQYYSKDVTFILEVQKQQSGTVLPISVRSPLSAEVCYSPEAGYRRMLIPSLPIVGYQPCGSGRRASVLMGIRISWSVGSAVP